MSSLSCRIIDYLEKGEQPFNAGSKALRYLEELTGGEAGVVILDSKGNYAAIYNTEAMPWAYHNGKITHGFWRGDSN